MPSKQVRTTSNLPARPEHDRDDRKTNMPKNQRGKKTKHVSKAAFTHTHCRCHRETPFTQKPSCTHTILHRDALTHKPFYTQTLLDKKAFTHRHFYTDLAPVFTPLHGNKGFGPMGGFALYTMLWVLFMCPSFLHFYTQTLLHTNIFTQKHSYTQTLLHRDTFTHKSFYTQTLLHRCTCTHKHFYTQTSLHRNARTHKPLFLRKDYSSTR